jgi:hypothetical protein
MKITMNRLFVARGASSIENGLSPSRSRHGMAVRLRAATCWLHWGLPCKNQNRTENKNEQLRDRLFCLSSRHEKFRNMMNNRKNRQAGSVSGTMATVAGAFERCMAAASLLTRYDENATPSGEERSK